MSITFLEGSQASPPCPSDKCNMNMKMSMGHMWNDADRWVAYREELINAYQILARKSEA
jgi:hypothetical protein